MSNLSAFCGYPADSKLPEAWGAHECDSRHIHALNLCSSPYKDLLFNLSLRHPLAVHAMTSPSTHASPCTRPFFFSLRSSHLGLFPCPIEAYSESDCCWEGFPPSLEGPFRAGAAAVMGLGVAWSVSTSGAELGPRSGDPPTSMLLCRITAAHSRCQAGGKMLQTFPGMKWFD